MTGADLRVDHQDRPGLAQLHAVGGGLDTEGRRGARHVHVETETLDAQRFLDFDGNGWIGALQVGTGDDHAVDVRGGLAGALQGLFGRADGHLAQHRPLVVGALRQAWGHALRVEDAILVHDKAAFDARGLFDERGAGFGQCLHFTARNGIGVVGVELRDVSIERLHQLFVGNAIGRGVQAGAADDDVMHGRVSNLFRQKALAPSYQYTKGLFPSGGRKPGIALFRPARDREGSKPRGRRL
ncbi:hypothetical protein D9M70_107280 [compost metagenome]